jgi:hypothetical protein
LECLSPPVWPKVGSVAPVALLECYDWSNRIYWWSNWRW